LTWACPHLFCSGSSKEFSDSGAAFKHVQGHFRVSQPGELNLADYEIPGVQLTACPTCTGVFKGPHGLAIHRKRCKGNNLDEESETDDTAPPLPGSQPSLALTPANPALAAMVESELEMDYSSWTEEEQAELLHFFHEPLSTIHARWREPLLNIILPLMERLGAEDVTDPNELRLTSLCFFLLPGLLRQLQKLKHLDPPLKWINATNEAAEGNIEMLQSLIVHRAIQIRDVISNRDPPVGSNRRPPQGEVPWSADKLVDKIEKFGKAGRLSSATRAQ